MACAAYRYDCRCQAVFLHAQQVVQRPVNPRPLPLNISPLENSSIPTTHASGPWAHHFRILDFILCGTQVCGIVSGARHILPLPAWALFWTLDKAAKRQNRYRRALELQGPELKESPEYQQEVAYSVSA